MVLSLKTAGLALLSLTLATGQSTDIEECLALQTAIDNAVEATTITLGADFACETFLEIDASQEVTINGGDHVVTIGGLFAGTTEASGGVSLFVNKGTLRLNGVTFKTEAPDGARAVYNTGTLSVVGCAFELFHDGGFLDEGGAIFSDSDSTIDIEATSFQSNVALLKGGSVYASGSETMVITDCTFKGSEVGTDAGSGAGEGGDIWAGRNVELVVSGTVFSGSVAEAGGAAILCCGAEILNSTFSGTDSSSLERHFGAVQVGGPDEDACDRTLTITDTIFSGCTVNSAIGEGGSLAVFDTGATLTDCMFEASAGSAILFQSSSAAGEHKLDMTTVQFNENTSPAEAYASDNSQGAAVVVTNTGVSDGDEVAMGDFFNMFCFGNVPYECEFVYDGALVTHDGEFKCQICNIDGVRQASGADDDLLGASDRNIDSGSGDNQGIVIGLSLALGLTLVVIGALAVWKIRVRKNARRLMEDMGEGDL